MSRERPFHDHPERTAPQEKKYLFETTAVDGKLYNVELLESFAEQLPTEEVPLDQLQEAVSEGHDYWEDKKGKTFGPSHILKDWEAAKQREEWADHVATIQRANLSHPIWITGDGQVFNGMHRLTRAFIDLVSTIQVKRFSSLPEAARVRDK